VQLHPTADVLRWNVEASIKIGTVRGESVYLSRSVWAAAQPVSCSATRVDTHDDHIAVEWRPLALHPMEPIPEVEDQVVALAVTQGSVHADSTRDGRFRNGEFRNRTLLID
jgi:hypothetical protein